MIRYYHNIFFSFLLLLPSFPDRELLSLLTEDQLAMLEKALCSSEGLGSINLPPPLPKIQQLRKTATPRPLSDPTPQSVGLGGSVFESPPQSPLSWSPILHPDSSGPEPPMSPLDRQTPLRSVSVSSSHSLADHVSIITEQTALAHLQPGNSATATASGPTTPDERDAENSTELSGDPRSVKMGENSELHDEEDPFPPLESSQAIDKDLHVPIASSLMDNGRIADCPLDTNSVSIIPT